MDTKSDTKFLWVLNLVSQILSYQHCFQKQSTKSGNPVNLKNRTAVEYLTKNLTHVKLLKNIVIVKYDTALVLVEKLWGHEHISSTATADLKNTFNENGK